MPVTIISRRPSRPAAAALALAIAGWAAPAAAQTAACTPISSVPYVVSSPGVYCLTQNLATSSPSDVGIHVDASFVVIDLNGFRLNGAAAGSGTGVGVNALNQKNVTVRNGTVRGFFTGVLLNDSSSDRSAAAGYLVHDVTAVDSTWVGIYVAGRGNVVRHNIVRNTTGTTYYGPNSDTAGIIAVGAGGRVIDNDVIDTIGVGTGTGRGVRVVEAVGTLVERNRFTNSVPSTTVAVSIEYAVWDVLALGNRIGSMTRGIEFYPGATGKYGHNVTAGTPTPYIGGTDLGNNN